MKYSNWDVHMATDADDLIGTPQFIVMARL